MRKSSVQLLRDELEAEYVPPPPGIYACPSCGGGRALLTYCDYCGNSSNVHIAGDGAIRAGGQGGPLRGHSPIRERYQREGKVF